MFVLDNCVIAVLKLETTRWSITLKKGDNTFYM